MLSEHTVDFCCLKRSALNDLKPLLIYEHWLFIDVVLPGEKILKMNPQINAHKHTSSLFEVKTCPVLLKVETSQNQFMLSFSFLKICVTEYCFPRGIFGNAFPYSKNVVSPFAICGWHRASWRCAEASEHLSVGVPLASKAEREPLSSEVHSLIHGCFLHGFAYFLENLYRKSKECAEPIETPVGRHCPSLL